MFFKEFLIIVCVLFISATSSYGEVYSWTDENGVLRFSDAPVDLDSDDDVVINEEIESTPIEPEFEVDIDLPVETPRIRKKSDPEAEQRKKEIDESEKEIKRIREEIYGKITGTFESGLYIKKKKILA